MNPNLYDNGSPFDRLELLTKNFKQFLLYLKDRQPIVIVVIGGQSSGKTTLGIHISDLLNKLCGLPEVTINKQCLQYSQGHKDFLSKLPQCAAAGYPAHQWDEAGSYSRKYSLTRDNKVLDQAMDVVRVHQTAIILVRHDINKIPKELIDHEIITMLIRCKKRVVGSGYVEAEVYDYESMCYLINYLKKEFVPQKAFKMVFPNFHFRFKDLSPERSAALDKLSSTKKLEKWDETNIKQQNLLTFQEIAEKLNMSVAWVKAKVSELHIKESIVNKKRKYFENNVVEKLRYKIK